GGGGGGGPGGARVVWGGGGGRRGPRPAAGCVDHGDLVGRLRLQGPDQPAGRRPGHAGREDRRRGGDRRRRQGRRRDRDRVGPARRPRDVELIARLDRRHAGRRGRRGTGEIGRAT